MGADRVPLLLINTLLTCTDCDMIPLIRQSGTQPSREDQMNPPTNKDRTFPPEPLTKAEAKALLHTPSGRAPTGIRNRALIATMYGAGLRLGETLALRPIDIDLDDASIRILHGKGDKARTVGVDDGALMHIARWIDARRVLGIKGRVLYCTLDGGPLQPRYVRAMLTRYAAKAGVEKRVHPHGFRHTHATELEREGFTVTEIQQQLGHSSLATTEAYLKTISPSRRVAKIRARRSVL